MGRGGTFSSQVLASLLDILDAEQVSIEMRAGHHRRAAGTQRRQPAACAGSPAGLRSPASFDRTSAP